MQATTICKSRRIIYTQEAAEEWELKEGLFSPTEKKSDVIGSYYHCLECDASWETEEQALEAIRNNHPK